MRIHVRLSRPGRAAAAMVAAVLVLTPSVASGSSVSARVGPPASATTAHPARDGQLLFPRYDPTLDDDVPITVNPDGSHATQVYPFAMECPHWSPNGNQIASCGTPSGDGTTILTVGTGHARYLPFLPGLFSPCFVWSPDASRLACEASSDTDPSLNGIYTVRVRDWGDVRRVTFAGGGDDVPGDFSPDGRRLVFARYTEDEGTPLGLFVVNVDGSGLTRLTPDGSDVSTPGSWSPDGNEIAFSRHATDDSRQTIWVVHANGQGLHQIPIDIAPSCGGPFTDPASAGCSGPVWSPSGRRIAFLVNSAAGSSLFTANVRGGQVRHVADDVDDSADWGVRPLAH